jgi:hypothetical protein
MTKIVEQFRKHFQTPVDPSPDIEFAAPADVVQGTISEIVSGKYPDDYNFDRPPAQPTFPTRGVALRRPSNVSWMTFPTSRPSNVSRNQKQHKETSKLSVVNNPHGEGEEPHLSYSDYQ